MVDERGPVNKAYRAAFRHEFMNAPAGSRRRRPQEIAAAMLARCRAEPGAPAPAADTR